MLKIRKPYWNIRTPRLEAADLYDWLTANDIWPSIDLRNNPSIFYDYYQLTKPNEWVAGTDRAAIARIARTAGKLFRLYQTYFLIDLRFNDETTMYIYDTFMLQGNDLI